MAFQLYYSTVEIDRKDRIYREMTCRTRPLVGFEPSSLRRGLARCNLFYNKPIAGIITEIGLAPIRKYARSS